MKFGQDSGFRFTIWSQGLIFKDFWYFYRSSHQRCSIRNVVLGNFTKFTVKHLCQSLFFKKVAGLRPATLLKKRLWHRCFPVDFVKFPRTSFFTEHLWTTASMFSLDKLLHLELRTCHLSVVPT